MRLISIFSLDGKHNFLSAIENATFSLLDSSSILQAFVISSLLTKEYNDKFLQKDKNYLKFYQDEIVKMADVKLKEQKVKEFSECLLLSKIKSSMMHLGIICDLYIKNDAMRIFAQELRCYSSLFLINNLTEYLGDSQNNEFVNTLINPIEEEIPKFNMPPF